MSRRYLVALSAPGPTWQYLSAESLAGIRNGDGAKPVTNNPGASVKGGYDYSYATYTGSRSIAFRSKFKLWEWGRWPVDSPYYDNIFLMGRFDDGAKQARHVYYFFGARCVVEYFDVNALVDFTGVIDKGADVQAAMRRFVECYSECGFHVTQYNDHLINVEL